MKIFKSFLWITMSIGLALLFKTDSFADTLKISELANSTIIRSGDVLVNDTGKKAYFYADSQSAGEKAFITDEIFTDENQLLPPPNNGWVILGGSYIAPGKSRTFEGYPFDEVEMNINYLFGVKETPRKPDPDPAPAPEPEPIPEPRYLEKVSNQLSEAIEKNETGTIYTNDFSLSYDVVEMIRQSNMSVEMHYTYEGVDYIVIINKNNLPTEVHEWYGPAYLAGLAGSNPKPVGGQSTSASNSKYTIVSGDTLGSIAAKYNTTVAAILARNSFITDPDMIYVGQELDI